VEIKENESDKEEKSVPSNFWCSVMQLDCIRKGDLFMNDMPKWMITTQLKLNTRISMIFLLHVQKPIQCLGGFVILWISCKMIVLLENE